GRTALADAERWIAAGLAELAPREQKFLDAGRAQEKRRISTEQEALRKREQEALRLIADAYRALYSSPEKALLLAEQAFEVDPTTQAQAAQSAALEVLQKRRQIRQDEARQWGTGAAWIAPTFFEGKLSAQLSRDGRFVILATERGENQAYVLDYET